MVAESLSVNMVTPYLSTFSSGFAEPPPRYLRIIFCSSSKCAGMFAFGYVPSKPDPNDGFLPKSDVPILSTISLVDRILIEFD